MENLKNKPVSQWSDREITGYLKTKFIHHGYIYTNIFNPLDNEDYCALVIDSVSELGWIIKLEFRIVKNNTWFCYIELHHSMALNGHTYGSCFNPDRKRAICLAACQAFMANDRAGEEENKEMINHEGDIRETALG